MKKLKWSLKKKEQLIRVIMKNRSWRFGSSCIYLPLSKTVGVKLYRTKRARNITHERQVYAAKYGLAPLCGNRFSLNCYYIRHENGDNDEFSSVMHNTVYGYLTQIAEIRDEVDESEFYLIRSQLKEIGIAHCDLWEGNVGYIKNKIICIDFDSNSCRWRRKCRKIKKIGS